MTFDLTRQIRRPAEWLAPIALTFGMGCAVNVAPGPDSEDSDSRFREGARADETADGSEDMTSRLPGQTDSSGTAGEASTSPTTTTMPSGQGSGCTEAESLEHGLLDAFVAAHPASSIPRHDALTGTFVPEANGHRMTHARSRSGDELIDPGAGGVTEDNLAEGRAVARSEAVTTLGVAEADILDTREPMPTFDGSADDTCGRAGIAIGSFLYRTPEAGLNEVVYMYIGLCRVEDGDRRDAEAYYHSAAPLEVCEQGTVMLE